MWCFNNIWSLKASVICLQYSTNSFHISVMFSWVKPTACWIAVTPYDAWSVDFTCCLEIVVQRYFNFLIASIFNDDWGQKFYPGPLHVNRMRKTMNIVSVCFFFPFLFFFVLHSFAALNKHTENNSDDCDVNHSCIKTMTHSPKAAIIGIKPSCTWSFRRVVQQVISGNNARSLYM